MLVPVQQPQLLGKILSVDSVYGNDASGNPYLTLSAARAAAVAGDTIIVRPGTYVVSGSLTKHGVDWLWEPGAVIVSTASVFTDGAAEADYIFDGTADIDVTMSGVQAAAFQTDNANSNVFVRCRNISASGGHATTGAACRKGRLSVEADSIQTTSPTNNHTYAVWWHSGSMYVRANRIQAGNAVNEVAVLSSAFTALPITGEMNVTAEEIYGYYAIGTDGNDPLAAAWITAKTIQTTSPSAGGAFIVLGGSNRMYVTAQKIFGRLICIIGASLSYIDTEKLSANADGSTVPAVLFVDTGFTGVLRLRVWEVDPVTFTGPMFTVAAGTVEIEGMRYVANAGSEGFSVSGGTVRLINCTIDTSANSSTNPITKSGGTLELENCTLIAHSTRNSIEAATAQTVKVIGTLAINRPVHANVTLSSDAPPVIPGFVVTGFASLTAANTFTVGPQTINTGAAANIGAIVKGAAAQTANLQEWQDSTGAVGARVDSSRNFSRPGAGASSEAFGAGAVASGASSLAVGAGASATGVGAHAVGAGANTGTGTSCFIFGNFNNSANRSNFVCIGINATVGNSASVAVGTSSVGGGDAVSIGSDSNSSGGQAVAIGGNASATHQGALSIGRVATSEATGDITFGGFGSSGKQFRLVAPSTTNNSRDQYRVETTWIDPADASRTSRATQHVFGNAVKQEAMRFEGNSGGVRIGAFGAAAVAKPTVTGSRGGNAALASLLTALANLGWITDSTTA